MYKQEFWRRPTTMGRVTYYNIFEENIERLLREAGINDIYRKTFSINMNNASQLESQGLPKSWANYSDFPNGVHGSESYQGAGSYQSVKRCIYFIVDGVKYAIFMGNPDDYSYTNCFIITDMENEGNKMDFYSKKLFTKQICQKQYQVNWIDKDDQTTTVTIIRDATKKLFILKLNTGGQSGYANNFLLGHVKPRNLSSSENDVGVWSFTNVVFDSKKGFNTKEDGFSYINPLSGYSGKFNPSDNIDLINNKVYIQPAMFNLHRHGIVGELSDFYFHTINGIRNSEIVNLSGKIYLEIVSGLIWEIQ